MDPALELMKEKVIFNTRFNPNHDKEGKFAPKGAAGGSSGGSGSSSKWSSAVDDMQAEWSGMKDNKKALYLVKNGFLSKEDGLKHMKDGTIDQKGKEYFEILKENGDYTPTKSTKNNDADRSQNLVDEGKATDRMQAQNEGFYIIKRKDIKKRKDDEERSAVMDRKEFEKRSFNFDIKAEQNESEVGVITGRPIVYNSRTNLGLFDEIIEAGALDKADLRDVRFLVNHDVSRIPLARSRNNNANSTMQLMPDNEGMQIRVNLDVKNNTEAKNLYSAIERGDISGMSFMFIIDNEEWTDLESEHPVRHIKKISNVIEVSACTFPSYEDTSISVRNKEALESAKKALESARRSLDSDGLQLEKAKFEAMMKMR